MESWKSVITLLGAILLVCVTIVTVNRAVNAHFERMAERGYEQVTIPGKDSSVWQRAR